jgi:hypothetical protein
VLGPDALAFASDGGGNPFFVDLESGAVKLCLHDAKMQIVPLFPSFEAFVDALEIDEEMI